MNRQIPRTLPGELKPYVFGQFFDQNGVLTIPSAADVEFKLASGIQFPGAGSIVIDPNSGIITYEWGLGESDLVIAEGIPSINHRSEWTITVSGNDYEVFEYFDVPLADLKTNVKDLDVVRKVPLLDSHRQKHRGPIGSTSTTGFIIDLDTLTRYPSQYWVGARIEGDGMERIVTQFDQITGKLTVNAAFDTVPTGAYTLHESFDYQIARAWTEIQGRLIESFGRDNFGRIMDGLDLSEAHLYLSCKLASYSRISEGGSVFREISQDMGTEYNAAYERIALKISNLYNSAGSNDPQNSGDFTEMPSLPRYWGV